MQYMGKKWGERICGKYTRRWMMERITEREKEVEELNVHESKRRMGTEKQRKEK